MCYPWFLIGYVAALLLSFFAYLLLWKGALIPVYLALPFLVHALCILPVNNLTYSMLRQGYLHRLLVNLALSVIVGLVLVLVLQYEFSVNTLALVVPLQLLLLVSLSLSLDWGRRRVLYG